MHLHTLSASAIHWYMQILGFFFKLFTYFWIAPHMVISIQANYSKNYELDSNLMSDQKWAAFSSHLPFSHLISATQVKSGELIVRQKVKGSSLAFAIQFLAEKSRCPVGVLLTDNAWYPHISSHAIGIFSALCDFERNSPFVFLCCVKRMNFQSF